MPLPRLPPEVWFRICRYLDAPSLSSVSQVSKDLHAVSMDEEIFQCHIPVLKTNATHPAQLYRRLCALQRPPNACLAVKQTSKCDIFCTVQHSLLLVEDETNFLIFPSGKRHDIESVIGEIDDFLLSEPPYYAHLDSFLRINSTVLPGGRIAFLNDTIPTRLSILDVNSGEIVVWRINRKWSPKSIVPRKYIVPAANNAELVMFYADEDTVALFDWRNGTLVREIPEVDHCVKLIMGECPAIDGMSVVGVVDVIVEEALDSVVVVRCKGFDDEEMMMILNTKKHVEVVLRSADKKTYVAITAADNQSTDRDKTEFMACRVDGDNLQSWQGELSMWTWPELRENGRVIIAKCGVTLLKCADPDGSQKQLWVELKDNGTTRTTNMPDLLGMSRRRTEMQPVWLRRTADGGALALLVCTLKEPKAWVDVIDLVKFVNFGYGSKMVRLQRWSGIALTDWCVVADHWVVAKRCRGGTLCVYHFDEFCGATGEVYKCPGLIPKRYKVKEREWHVNKRVRTLDEDGP